jgi:cytochrome c553
MEFVGWDTQELQAHLLANYSGKTTKELSDAEMREIAAHLEALVRG